MSNSIFLLYETDKHHSKKNRLLLIAADSKDRCIQEIERHTAQEDHPLDDNDYRMLEICGQTQGHAHPTIEYDIDELDINEPVFDHI